MMMKHTNKWILFAFLFSCSTSFASKVGLLIVATGNYIQFVEQLVESARKHFCTHHDVTYFVFTDGKAPQADDIVQLEHKRLGWPHDTMMRLSVYDKYAERLSEMDYLFATDADMRFVDAVGDEILSERVATQHPGYVGRRGTYETRRISTAYVAPHEGQHYFAGGFNGGTATAFLALAKKVTENIQKDLEKGVIAVWHDESHINRYFIDNPPTCILSPSYCYPESTIATGGKQLNYTPRLIALDKNHGALRKK